MYLATFTSALVYMNRGDAIYWNVFGLSIGYQLYHGKCASCIDQILCYTHNSLLLLIKQKLRFIQYESNMIMLKQMIMNMNLLMQVMSNNYALNAIKIMLNN